MGEFEGWHVVLGRIVGHADLTAEEASDALGEILAGRATQAQSAAFMVGLRLKGETAEEIVGLVDAMLRVAAPLNLPAGTIDIVGTGGSSALGKRAFNVSTIACIGAAGAGATVCKHGNRKASSTSGSTDMLEALGVAVDLDGPAVERCVSEAGVGFCFARMFHPAMRHVGPVRAELGIPTVFNILGPMSHPGRVRRQLLGVADPNRVDVMAEVLRQRGMERAIIVHGHDGLDELTTTDTSTLISISGSSIERRQFDPAEVGLPRRTLDEVAVGDPTQNAAVARRILAGESGAHRDLVVLNTAAGLVVADVAADLVEGVALAAAAIDSGAASDVLDRLVVASHA